jgi:foldase protein PrsA
MPKNFRTASLAALAAAAVAVSGCGGDSVPSDSVATVGEEEITKAEFNHWLTAAAKQQAQSTGAKPEDVVVPDPPSYEECAAAKAKQEVPKGVPKPQPADLEAQCKQEYEGLRDQTMQFLISSEWLIQEAEERDITASEKEVQDSFEQQKQQSFPKEKDYRKFLETSGQTEDDLLYRVRLSVLTNKLQQAIIKDEGKVTDQQIEEYYNENKERFAQPETRDLLVVLNPKKAEAEAARAALEDGDSWESVAKEYSTDDASKAQGGKLPNVTKGQQEAEFDKAIFEAEKGEIVGPVKTQFGYYVFEVQKVTPAKQQSLAEVEETIKNLLTSQNQQEALNDFVEEFQESYREETECAEGYVIEQCENAPKPESATQPISGGSPETGTGVPQPAPGGAPGGAVPPGAVPPGAGGAPQQVPPGAGGAPQQVPPGAGGGGSAPQAPPGSP